MSRLFTFLVDPDNVDPNGLVEDQTPVGAIDLTLDGALISGGAYSSVDKLGHRMIVTTVGNMQAFKVPIIRL